MSVTIEFRGRDESGRQFWFQEVLTGTAVNSRAIVDGLKLLGDQFTDGDLVGQILGILDDLDKMGVDVNLALRRKESA